jgi:hypothetical protein
MEHDGHYDTSGWARPFAGTCETSAGRALLAARAEFRESAARGTLAPPVAPGGMARARVWPRFFAFYLTAAG